MTICKPLAYPVLSESSSLEQSLSPQLLTALMFFLLLSEGQDRLRSETNVSFSTDPLSFPWGLWVSPGHMT